VRRHDESLLWEYAAAELEREEARVLEAHLEDCPECRERLAAVQVAREALEAARSSQPAIGWGAVDGAVDLEVERRLRFQAQGPWRWTGRGALALVGVGAALAAVLLSGVVPPAPSTAPSRSGPEPLAGALVEAARGLERLGARPGPLEVGDPLEPGSALATSRDGRAFLRLAEGSRLRLGAASALSLQDLAPDAVALRLEHGRVSVHASHQARRAFVVQAGGLTVRVVGTVFAVAQGAPGTEVAVAEGQVQVELPGGGREAVTAGQRLRVDPRGKVHRGLALTAGDRRELDEVRAMGTAVGGAPPSPPPGPSPRPSRALPRLDPAEARARQASLPPEVTTGLPPEALSALPEPARLTDEAPAPRRLEPQTQVEVEEPGTAWPSMAGVPAQRSPPPLQAPPQPDVTQEWATLPAPSRPRPAPRDLETRFLEHAEASLAKGECDRYQVGLEDLAEDAAPSARTELARVLRARCFSQLLRPRQAMNEYRKYLQVYPRGRFVDEASDALGP
jgi:ferric-dicitrate binding protein FerR (iron transport regulator)